MLGMSYGELFLLLGATAALIGPKDLPRIARMAGRLAGRSIGYVQIARGQFDNILQQSQAREVHKELQDALSQLEAIRYEVRSLSMMNPGPMTRRLIDGDANTSSDNQSPTMQKLMDNVKISPTGEGVAEEINRERQTVNVALEADGGNPGNLTSLHCEAIKYEKLAKIASQGANCSSSNEDIEKLSEDAGGLSVLPISAESAGLLPPHKSDMRGSDIMLEAILEAEVAANAKHFVDNKLQLE
ncbi:hypothetical protein H6P81_004752 [Aristolochia fimbriata]|uniref:Sec-independent protein translocase protein TatB-like n=1 Tax=Aristolochia fimbriata TaxID=158543 RepID=A0AAV7EX13_ARIFI|nr:hypothetical protein H6P81_004752 [Aristolochia fimbriata]